MVMVVVVVEGRNIPCKADGMSELEHFTRELKILGAFFKLSKHQNSP
jgi:hypothetical protein